MTKKMKQRLLIIFASIVILFGAGSAIVLTKTQFLQEEVLLAKKQIDIVQPTVPTVEINPEQNEEIGLLTFDKLNVSVPVVYGYNEDYMANYYDEVGLEAWNNFPGQNNKLYINGHRHLAFQNLKYLEVDDTITLTMPYGQYVYKVNREPQIVLATDPEAVDFYFNDHDTVFDPQILRLQTCYPFEAGSPLDHRYLVDFVLVESNHLSE